MRFLCMLLIGLVALSSVSAAQSLQKRGTQTWSSPGGKSVTPPRSRGGSGLSITIPLTVIPQVAPRSCPKGTTGKWPNCQPVAQKCPKGTTGKWPDCVKVAKPTDKPCPEGQTRKGKKCVQITQGGSGKAPPAKAKGKPQETIPPAIAALVAGRPHRPREVLVLVDGARAAEIATRLARQYNVTAEPNVAIALLNGAIVRLRISGNRSLESVLAALSADPDVQLAQPNYDYLASKGPVPQAGASHYASETIRLKEAHRLARGQGVLIAVIDTAIEANHPELDGAITGKFDAIGGASPPDSHGTEIAGILAARAQLTGVAPEAKLLSVRAFRGGKAGPAESTTLQLLKGIDWAFASGAKVMNMSFAGPMDPLLERAIAAASANGAIFIAAAGNNGPKAPPAYPAAYPDVIAVTAIGEDDKLYAKANQGDYIAVAAPGIDIVVPELKGKYGVASGTSMAAAHVSGVVALLLERDAKLNAAEIQTILSSSARKPGKPLDKAAVGAGILDAASAVAGRAAAETGQDRPSKADISAAP